MQGIKEGIKKRNSLTLVGFTHDPGILSGPHAGLPWSGKNLGKTIISQGQRKVREFCKRSGKIIEVVRVREFYFRCEQNPVKSIKRSKTKRKILMAYKRS